MLLDNLQIHCWYQPLFNKHFLSPALSPLVGDDVLETLTLEGSVNARNHIGGTAPAQVRAAIARHRARLASA